MNISQREQMRKSFAIVSSIYVYIYYTNNKMDI